MTRNDIENIDKSVLQIDIKNSTGHFHDGAGQKEFSKVIENNKSLFHKICVFYSGEYYKDIGDGHISLFSNPLDALLCALVFYRATNNIEIEQRIAITKGIITENTETETSEAFILAARLQEIAPVGKIVLSEDFYGSIFKINKKIEELCGNSNVNVKGFEQITIHTFDPNNENVNCIIDSHKVEEMINVADVDPVNVLDEDYKESRVMIWPVVPRHKLNLIHLGQISLISFLHRHLGWSIKILIADMADDSVTSNYVDCLKKYLKNNGYQAGEIFYLSKLMEKETTSCCKITKDLFNNYLKDITFDQMTKFVQKSYTTDEYKTRQMWKVLRPLFTLSASMYLSDTLENKCIVIAGEDEHSMWTTCTARPDYENKIGAMLVPTLSRDGERQFSHDDETFYWTSVKAIKESMRGANITKWVKNLMLKLQYDELENHIAEDAVSDDIARYIYNSLKKQR